jgi:hypothetical protein
MHGRVGPRRIRDQDPLAGPASRATRDRKHIDLKTHRPIAFDAARQTQYTDAMPRYVASPHGKATRQPESAWIRFDDVMFSIVAFYALTRIDV